MPPNSSPTEPPNPVSQNSVGSKTRHLRNQPLGLIPSSILKTTPQEDPAFATLAQLAAQIRQDPVAMRRLSERVIEMLRLDLHQQRERGQQYSQW
ncbi:MAG: hypothetical protein AAFY20_07575 [Cyanobacteria bacterium J06639_14]